VPPSLVENLPFSARELDQVLFIPLPLDLCKRRPRSIFDFDEFRDLRVRTSIEDVRRNIPIKESDVLEVFFVLAHDESAGEGWGHGVRHGGDEAMDLLPLKGSYLSERGAARQADATRGSGGEAGEEYKRGSGSAKPGTCTTMTVQCILSHGRVLAKRQATIQA